MKVLVLSPVSSNSSRMIWLPVLSEVRIPSPVNPNVKKSTTIGCMLVPPKLSPPINWLVKLIAIPMLSVPVIVNKASVSVDPKSVPVLTVEFKLVSDSGLAPVASFNAVIAGPVKPAPFDPT